MTRKNILVLLIILAIFGFTLWTVVPLLSSVELIYQPEFSENITAQEKTDAIETALATIQGRIEEAGIDNAVVQRYGDEGIQVKLPEYSDENAAISLIGSVDPFQVDDIFIHGERFGRRGLHLGLDLVGGVRLVYEVEFTDNTTDNDAAMERTLTTIQRRIDKYGVTEPKIERYGEDRIEVQLTGFTDIDTAKRLVEQTGFLEFREVELNASGTPVYLKDYLAQDQLSFIDTTETADRLFVVSDRARNSGAEMVARFSSCADCGFSGRIFSCEDSGKGFPENPDRSDKPHPTPAMVVDGSSRPPKGPGAEIDGQRKMESNREKLIAENSVRPHLSWLWCRRPVRDLRNPRPAAATAGPRAADTPAARRRSAARCCRR